MRRLVIHSIMQNPIYISMVYVVCYREMIRLSGDYNQLYSSDYNSTDIEVFLTNRDYYRLQMSLDFASSEENTYLTCDAGVIVSMSGVSRLLPELATMADWCL